MFICRQSGAFECISFDLITYHGTPEDDGNLQEENERKRSNEKSK